MTDSEIRGLIAELEREQGKLAPIVAKLKEGIDGLKALLKPSSKGVKTPLKAPSHAARHLREHRPGRPSKIDSDPELHAFINARIDTMTFPALEKAVAKKFPPNRRVGKNAIHQ
ncbi:hypothetical protein ROLI_006400 [Roseobacter fucihabitans]|uniref:Transposase n=1 Tax=Roseobacter fucihabitans TaxID=1537242 RepID=A0ABZ2BNG9_9RHOB|nr:hypothetical protein [Roseobacter litoralis]MBC6966259.1 hypothetical protein [Roseobacter litoralis]